MPLEKLKIRLLLLWLLLLFWLQMKKGSRVEEWQEGCCRKLRRC
jgi:hypothetical protein